MQKTQNVLPPWPLGDAVLSQYFPQPADDFLATEFHALYQPHDHPHVGQHRRAAQTRLAEHHPFQAQFGLLRQIARRWFLGRRGWQIASGRRRKIVRPLFLGRRRIGSGWLRQVADSWFLNGRRRRGGIDRLRQVAHPWFLGARRRRRGSGRVRTNGGGATVTTAIELLLLPLSEGRLTIRLTPLARTLPAMLSPTAERTTQVPPSNVPGMGEKANLAMHALRYATLQIRMRLQDPIQLDLILPDKRPGAVGLVPISLKRENFLDGDDKKTRLSVITWIVSCTASAYLNEAQASRGRPRFFLCHEPTKANVCPYNRSPTSRSANPHFLPLRRILPAPAPENDYLERRSPTIFSFPSSGSAKMTNHGSI